MAPGPRWEFYGKYALRSSNADLSSLGLSSISNTIHLAQMRAAYRFAYRWDVVGEARYIAQPANDYYESALALETGYYVTPDLRLGVGYSFGAVDDRSFQNNYRDDGGFYLAATFKVNELLNGFGLQDIALVQQAEALVERDDEVAVDDVCPESTDPSAGGVDPCENRAFKAPEIIVPEPPVLPEIPISPIEPEMLEPEVPAESEDPIRGLW
ncbi:MAG: hypothetical protein AAFY72_09690 [Cyanobacteria bacterium J06649_4]